MKRIFILAFLLAGCTLSGAEIRVGVARKVITPETPIWLSGYASRNKPSSEILHDLWAKALVIEESKSRRIIIVTTDIIGFSHDVSEDVTRRIITKYGIDRSQLLLNSSHTHSGPVIWPSLNVMYDLSISDLQNLVKYSRKLTDAIVEVIDSAMINLSPGQLSVGHGIADFAINRRESTEKGFIIGINRNGPVDHDVPVLKVAAPDGRLLAVLFGYACHNTTLSEYSINGDYAGFAQIELEKAYPGTTAMFLAGCGADQNPEPRRTVELAMQHGKSLAGAVQKVLHDEMLPVRSPIRTDYTEIGLEFRPFDPAKYQDEILGDDRFRQQRASLLLEAYDKGWNVTRLTYPVQAVRFNNDLTILALSGEVVVDYSLAMKKKYPDVNLFVAGYCTKVQCYIPSRRILMEGGYEPDISMIYYGLPGPFADNIEDKIFSAINRVMKNTGERPSKRQAENQ
ncbi:MAG: neutral/alkaline non-lysosomal ceramidase N-terminal domain-containing protein [Bacteroidales bacterium]|nr:neutral/alkaline non-lysosomal ceramidase N-terminal domain-containing protein [Bacteroidales bacterium]